MDAICLKGLSFYGYHGARPEERSLGQRFVVDVRLELDLAPAARSDDVADTVHYSHAWNVVRSVVEGEPVNLIERLAERVALELLARFERVTSATVRVEKPGAPVAGAASGAVAVELTRRRERPADPTGKRL